MKVRNSRISYFTSSSNSEMIGFDIAHLFSISISSRVANSGKGTFSLSRRHRRRPSTRKLSRRRIPGRDGKLQYTDVASQRDGSVRRTRNLLRLSRVTTTTRVLVDSILMQKCKFERERGPKPRWKQPRRPVCIEEWPPHVYTSLVDHSANANALYTRTRHIDINRTRVSAHLSADAIDVELRVMAIDRFCDGAIFRQALKDRDGGLCERNNCVAHRTITN